MSTTAAQRVDLPSLAVVRLIPALLIFTAHVTQFHLFSAAHLQTFSSGFFNKPGYESVSFFIVLSGFILTWVAPLSGPDRVFLTKRFMKIYPTHVVTWAVCLALFGGGSLVARSLSLVLLHSWLPASSFFFAANVPAWTLCVEVLFYASFGFWYARLRAVSTRALWATGIGLALVVVSLPYLLMPFPDGHLLREPAFTRAGEVTPVSEWKFWAVYIFPPTRLAEALLGMAVALLVRRGCWPRVPLPLAAAALLATVVVATRELPLLAATSSITIVPIVVLVGGMATRDLRGQPPLFRAGRLAPLAKYTFNFYLAQWAVIWFWHRHASPTGYSADEGSAVFLALLCTTVVFATVLHKLVERPLTNAALRWVRAADRRTCVASTKEPATDRAHSSS